MDFSVSYDPDAFAGGADAVTGAVRDGMQALATRLAEALDEVYSTHAGRPAEEVGARLRDAAAARGFDLEGEELATCTEAIAAGRRLSVDVGWR